MHLLLILLVPPSTAPSYRSLLCLSLPVGGAVCWFVCLPACRQAGVPVGKQDGRTDGRQAGWTAGRLEREQACRPACVPIRFIYCTIPLLLHYYVNRRMYCTADLYHPNFTPRNPHLIAYTFIWSFAVVNQYNSKTAQQKTCASVKLCCFQPA